MQIIENWTELKGIVLAVALSDELKHFHLVELKIMQINEVEGFPNLVNETVGQSVDIFIDSNTVIKQNITENCCLICRVRKASKQRLFANQDYLTVYHEIS